MAFRCTRLFRLIKNGNAIQFSKCTASTIIPSDTTSLSNKTKYKTEDNFIYLEDPDSFGTLSRNVASEEDKLEDEDDIKEHQYLENAPLPSQKLTIKQYADIIKQYLSHKRLKEAIDVLEVRMLTVDRVKPENYIYNILIGACADVGYTKKAFKLFNDMKRRALKPSGDTYTCLFQACTNSPWVADGLKNAHYLREHMKEKGVEPNLTNYNAMIKAFGRCGDITTAFQIVDEMISKNIKIRVHTFNHLLHACIADKNTGLRHALVVWRKMLKSREKPNLFSFNLMLKCVKDCNLGTQKDIEDLIGILRENTLIGPKHVESLPEVSSETKLLGIEHITSKSSKTDIPVPATQEHIEAAGSTSLVEVNNESNLEKIDTNVSIIVDSNIAKRVTKDDRSVPNLLSKVILMQNVTCLQEVKTVQDKFAVVGGQEDFLKEMEVYSVNPDIKTFTQMLPLLDDNKEAENKLMETMKALKLRADIDFYNLLIKKRSLRSDFDGAFAVKEIIEQESKLRKKHHPLKKKIQLKYNIMTYGVLAMACQTRESAEKLLNEMKENQLKVNIEILGTLLKKGAMQMQFEYVQFAMKKVKEENIQVNGVFMDHLAKFIRICASKFKVKKETDSEFVKSYKKFLNFYQRWYDDVQAEEALKPEHPWQQFQENYPETVQRTNFTIKEPKRFFKRNRKFIAPYKAKI